MRSCPPKITTTDPSLLRAAFYWSQLSVDNPYRKAAETVLCYFMIWYQRRIRVFHKYRRGDRREENVKRQMFVNHNYHMLGTKWNEKLRKVNSQDLLRDLKRKQKPAARSRKYESEGDSEESDDSGDSDSSVSDDSDLLSSSDDE